jgi:hypothetical protein
MEQHELDPFSLVFGAVFTLLGLVFLFARPDITAFRWVWPIPILALGALVLTVGAGRSRRTREETGVPPSPPDDGDIDAPEAREGR